MGIFNFFRSAKSDTRPAGQRFARRFDAATANRLTAGWMVTEAKIDHELRSDLTALRARSRDLAKNNDYVRKYLQMVAANIVGPSGFNLQSRVEDAPGRQDKLANDAIEWSFYDWSRPGNCDVTGRLSFPDLCRAAIKAVARDGECLIRHFRGTAVDNPWGYALQLIDIDRLDTQLNRDPASGQNAIVMGIEINDAGRPLFYHIHSRHPSDYGGSQHRERIRADEIIHAFITEQPGQSRGYPWLHAVIKSLHDLGEYNKSALIAARKGADTLGFFVSPNGEPPTVDSDEAGEPISVSVPGQYDVLPEGFDFRPYDSQYPSATYGDFVKAHLRRIAAGLGVSYNTLAEDLEGVNYSSIRAGVLAERDQWMMLQNWFIDAVLEPVFQQWISLSLQNQAIKMPNGSALPLEKKDKFSRHAWLGRRWQWVDPLKDIEASRLAVTSGVASPQMIAAQQGVDVEDVLADIARFEALLSASGAQSVSYGKPAEAPPGKPPAENAE
jgi:lambda family phage portal protein